MTRLVITNGRIVDPASDIDMTGDLCISDGRIIAVGTVPDGFNSDTSIDATGQVVCAGLIDLCARLREPGQEQKATIDSESRAAAASGITTLCSPPDTNPVVDTTAVVELIHQRSGQSGMAKVEVIGALTKGLAGEQLAEMGALGRAGCVGISNGPKSVSDAKVLRRAMEYASTFGLTVFLSCEDVSLAGNGCVHEGRQSARLGLPAIPSSAESVVVARDLLLAEQTGARVHFCRLSTARSAQMVAQARAEGLPVSADVSAHQLHLSETNIAEFDSLYHVRPPLRSVEDRDGLRQGIANGDINAICSDHQPHERDAKLNPFTQTEPGISALETLLPLSLNLVAHGLLALPQLVSCLTSEPARILGLDRGTLAMHSPADVCIFNPELEWVLDENRMLSAGQNSPFIGQRLTGRVTHTLLDGGLVFRDDDDQDAQK